MTNKKDHKIKLLANFKSVFVLVFIFLQLTVSAQEQPPRPINVFVSPIQGLSFGSFVSPSAGGTVTVFPNGTRTSTGDIILLDLGFVYTPALFEIEGNEGTLISITFGTATLSGSNGGTMFLEVNSSDPVSPFILTVPYPARTLVRIGGVLTVGNTSESPAGSYSGTFAVTFNQE